MKQIEVKVASVAQENSMDVIIEFIKKLIELESGGKSREDVLETLDEQLKEAEKKR